MACFSPVKSIPSLVLQSLDMGAVQISKELEGLAKLVTSRKVRNFMEIGTETGGTFWLFCQLAHEDGIKISLDKPDGASGSWKFADFEAHNARSERLRGFAKYVHPIVADSHGSIAKGLVSGALDGDKLDFLFIDGDHTYDGVKADYLDYKEFVRPGGLIGFHDIVDTQYHRDRGCFVADFWNELQGKKHEFCSGWEWGGIGVIEN